MRYVLDNWSLDPFVVASLVAVVVHEVGLARLARREPAERRRRRLRSIFFYAGLVVLAIAVSSPLEYWSSRYFYVHMVQHLLLGFYAPILLVAGAPWTPLAEGLPRGSHRGAGRRPRPPSTRWRALRDVLTSPWFAVVSFNALMVLWHVPAVLDASVRDGVVRVVFLHGSLLVTGILFWLMIIPSAPFRMRASATFQIVSIIATNVVMFVLAMSMSIFSSTSWYVVYDHVPGVTLSPFADQQLGAAILWVCGDLWALPALTIVLRRAIDREGGLADAVDRLFHRAPSPDLGEFRGLP